MSNDDHSSNGVNRCLIDLTAQIAALDARSAQQHVAVVDRMTAIEAGQKLIVEHWQETGKAVAALQATCAARPAACGAAQSEQNNRATRLSDEVASVRELSLKTASRTDRNSEAIHELGGEVKEVSKVSSVRELERIAAKAAWLRVGRTIWHYGRWVLLALTTLGVIGAGYEKLLK